MFYTIHGFYQKAAHKLGLDNDDLLLLRWFVNFKDSGNMKSVTSSPTCGQRQTTIFTEADWSQKQKVDRYIRNRSSLWLKIQSLKESLFDL